MIVSQLTSKKSWRSTLFIIGLFDSLATVYISCLSVYANIFLRDNCYSGSCLHFPFSLEHWERSQNRMNGFSVQLFNITTSPFFWLYFLMMLMRKIILRATLGYTYKYVRLKRHTFTYVLAHPWFFFNFRR